MAAAPSPSSSTDMRVEVRKHTVSDAHAEEYIEFALFNVDNSFANGLRRVLLAEIPILAIDSVTVLSNTSVFHDEMLVHRLGLIPLASEFADHMSMPHEGDAEENCELNARLKVRCPADRHDLKVYSSMLTIERGEETGVRPVSKNSVGIWLFTLGRGQEVDFACKIRKGISKVHSRFMAVSTVAMQYMMDIRLNDTGLSELEPELRKEWVAKCPTRVFQYDDRDQMVTVENPEACTFCKECLEMDKPFDRLPAPLVAVRQRKNRFGHFDVVFKVETTGALPAKMLIERAIDALRNKLAVIKAALQTSNRALRKAEVEGTVPAEATRTIGQAPTALRIPNQEVAAARRDEDHLEFVAP